MKNFIIMSYKKAIENYNRKFKCKEKNDFIQDFKEDSDIILRLDGKNMSKLFGDESNIFNDSFYKTMYKIISNIYYEFRFIKFAYTFKDEISILINRESVENNETYNRYEKILSLVSGYISALFTKEIKKFTNKDKVYYFDARLILLNKNEIQDYFISRYNLSIRAFIDKIESYFKLDHNNVFDYEALNNLLTEHDLKLDEYLNHIYGYIGYKENNKWNVKIANNIKNF